MGRNREKIRNNLINKLKSDGHTKEYIDKKIKSLEFNDTLKDSVVIENIGKPIICKKCGEQFIANKKQHLYCRKCILIVRHLINNTNMKNAYEKANKTKLEKYGSKNNIEKIRKTNKERYGVEVQFKRKEVSDKANKTKLERYGSKNNIEKIRKTCLDRYGAKCSFGNKEVHKKCIDNMDFKKIVIKVQNTKLSRYGNKGYTNINKIQETKLKKYGNKNYNNIDKIKSTMMLKYGVDNYKAIVRKIPSFRMEYELQ